jgi:VIT1/CCC1 family predicted Fe2+/Mn2+ transporter
MDMPPTRFRVVERGRRLEVIDTATGRAIGDKPRSDRAGSSVASARADTPLMLDQVVGRASVPRSKTAPQPGALPRATRFDGTVSFTTRTFYDDHAPRTVTLNPARAKILRGVAFVALVLLIITPALLLMLAWSSFPLLVVLAAVVFNPKVRERLRAGVTSLIDRYTDPA